MEKNDVEVIAGLAKRYLDDWMDTAAGRTNVLEYMEGSFVDDVVRLYIRMTNLKNGLPENVGVDSIPWFMSSQGVTQV